jgi:hypothetical protein
MHKKRWLGFSLILLIAAAIWGMPGSEKRHRDVISGGFAEDGVLPQMNTIVTSTTLADTLAPEFVQMLGISDVRGTKIVAPAGTWSSYFTYRADRRKLFSALERLPFMYTDNTVDLAVREISYGDLHRVKMKLESEEIVNTSSFWTPADDSKVFEFVKPPFRHTLIVLKDGNSIQHRVEYMS